MGRTLHRLTLDNLALLRSPCRACVFWECDAVRRDQLSDDPGAREEKDGWVSDVLREWGSCGQVIEVDGRPVGHVLYAPPAFVPGAAGFPTAPVSSDAVLMTSLHVEGSHRGGGLGRMLVQGMARDLVRRNVRAVEAFSQATGRRDCVVPTAFLDAVGFRTQRTHDTVPRMRMELRTALTWRTEVEAAWGRLIGVVRPVAPGNPGGVTRN
jgi:GNAT superfamily N-acetyltransferase